MKRFFLFALSCSILFLSACVPKSPQAEVKKEPAPVYFKVDQATAGIVKGAVRFTGKQPPPRPIDMSNEPACVEARRGKAFDESLLVNPAGALANVFVYVKSGLEGKKFEAPKTPVTIDQRGCWFQPRVLGIQTGQTLQVTNSDGVTHNIHPLAQVNREWNQSQSQGDPPLSRKFLKPEIMIRVKCNIHSWMRAHVGVLDHPYFAVTGPDGNFEMRNLPPGDYVIEAWHEIAGAQEHKITVTTSGIIETTFLFKGE